MADDLIRFNAINSGFSGKYLLCGIIDGSLPKFETVTLPTNDADHSDRTIHWGDNDAYVTHLRQAHARMLSSMESSPKVKKLCALREWTTEERKAWEKILFKASDKSIGQDSFFEYRLNQNRPVNMNEVDSKHSFACSELTITALSIVQAAEFHFLKDFKDQKSPANYYGAIVKRDQSHSRHALIISEKTGSFYDPANKLNVLNSSPTKFGNFITGQDNLIAPGLNNVYTIGSDIPFSLANFSPFWDTPKDVQGPIQAPPIYISLKEIKEIAPILEK